jgi:uncharacterized protein (TIRG00374 family)
MADNYPTRGRVVAMAEAPAEPEAPLGEEEVQPTPRRLFSGRRGLLVIVGLALAIAALYVLLPALAGFDETWSRVREGDPVWLLAALGLELLSYASYVVALRACVRAAGGSLALGDGVRVTMAGVVASRLLATAGAGGVAVTAWALWRFGMGRRQVTAAVATLLVLLYGLYMATLVVVGIALWAGVGSVQAPLALTLAPALLGAVVIAAALSAAAFAGTLEQLGRRIDRANDGFERVRAWAAAVPATLGTGVRTALTQLRTDRSALLGAAGWWAFDIAVLWACLAAFGDPPELLVIVSAYFVGMLANTLPIPGGVGAVDGGMIGALIALDVEPGLAIVGVLSYRFFAFWLPILPGVWAYASLLGSAPADRSE